MEHMHVVTVVFPRLLTSTLLERRLVKRCEKPDRKEFMKVARLTAVGFLAVGFLGFFVKLIFIPINQVCGVDRFLVIHKVTLSCAGIS